MLNKELLKEISSKIAALVPMATDIKEDVEKSIQGILNSAFTRLNLVTREEFDAQIQLLERAEATISRLEEQIAHLEQTSGLNQ